MAGEVTGQHGKQHVDLYRKLALRRQLLAFAAEGAAYVPFCGDGDIAAELYRDRAIFAADTDAARVTTVRHRFPAAAAVVADCDGWPFPGCDAVFAVADLDSYANPYKSLVSFWQNARKAKRIVVFGTDGMRQRIKRSKDLRTLPDGNETACDGQEWRAQYNFWWPKTVIPFLAETVSPGRIVAKSFYTRRDMVYWGIVVEV